MTNHGYLPPFVRRWAPAWLIVPASWVGGARRVKVKVDLGHPKMINGTEYLWYVVTARNDPHMLPGSGRAYIPADMIEERKVGK